VSVDFADYFAGAPIGFHCLGPDGVIVAVNDAELALLGYRRDQYVGRHIREFHVDAAVADDIMSALRSGEAIVGRRIMLRAGDGTPTPVVLSENGLMIDGRLVYTRGLIRDIRGEIEAERQLGFLADVGRTLARTLDPDVIWRGLTEAAHRILGASNVVLYRVEPGSGDLLVIEAAGEIGPGRFGRLPLGIGAAGLAARARRTVISANVLDDAAITLTEEARRWLAAMPHRAALAVPMLTEEGVLGVFGVGGPAGRAFSAGEIRLVEALADHAAMAARNAQLFTVEQQASRSAEGARRRALFLAEASRVLAGWVDYETTLGAIAELVIAHSADACLIDVADDDGRLRRVAAATRDRSRTQLAREFLDRFPPDPAGPHPIATAMRTGESVLQPQMPDAFFDAIARDAEHRRLTRELGLKSSIVVPMIARGRPLGTISLFAIDVVSSYGVEDLELAEDLTRRVAFAVENAQLHRESERRLQEAELVAQVARDINASLNLDTVMQRIVDTARALCRADLAALFLRDGPDAPAVPRYGAGGAPSARYRTVRIKPGEGLGGQVLLTGQALRTANYPEDARFSEEYRKLPDSEQIVALLAVPLRYGDYVRGLLYVANRTPRAFSERDEAVVQRLADHAAVAIQNVELFAREQSARSAAEEASRAKDEFVATLSHELRTPLNAILGWVRMLREGALDEATAQRGLEVIQRNARNQAQLIEDLLDVSRIATGKLRLDVRPLRIAEVIEAAVDTLRPAANAKEQRLIAVLDPRAGQVAGDAARLQQVATNLLSNAIKFTPRGGRVEVRLEQTASHVEIVVSDSGPGIPAQVLPHIFDRFRQADSSSTRQQAGLGLGLAVVRHLVELHGGTVEAAGAEGGGATFTVRLPVLPVHAVKPAGEPAASPNDKPPGVSLRGVRVLLVDDEADTLDIFTTVLATHGADIRTAASGSAALEILQTWTPDLLVSDVGMPGMDGYAFIRRVREMQAAGLPRIPAIAVTAFGRVQDRIRILDAGFQMHITKPVDPGELVAALASLGPRGF
jgi:PAS domain S-box-containing protein